MFPKVALHANGPARTGSLVRCKQNSRQDKCSQEDAYQPPQHRVLSSSLEACPCDKINPTGTDSPFISPASPASSRIIFLARITDSDDSVHKFVHLF